LGGAGDGDRLEVEPVVPLVAADLAEARGLVRRQEGGDHEERERQHRVVEREDAQDAARVEVLEEGRPLLAVEQDAGDQVAGEDEEEIDADRAPPREVVEPLVERVMPLVVREVAPQHQRDGEAAHAVEDRDVRRLVASGAAQATRPTAIRYSPPPNARSSARKASRYRRKWRLPVARARW